MYQVKTMNKIAKCGLDLFDAAQFIVNDHVEQPDAILVRSASLHDMELPKSLKAIARAGAGVNNIPVEQCSKEGIVVFNTPGANANAVKELVIAALLLSSRKILPAAEWVKTLKGKGAEISKFVEKGKSDFTGPEVAGKRLGIIGLGAIGVLVANAAEALGMEVIGYDPFLSVSSAWELSHSVLRAQNLAEIYETCDYITLHTPLTEDTRESINSETIATMKDSVRILNFARGDLVRSSDILKAVKNGKVACYVTDFPTDEQIGVENILAIPHLGASTPESEDNCAKMGAAELIDFLQNGTIRNSVNLPEVVLPMSTNERICVIHRNIPTMITQVSAKVSSENINIDNLLNKSKKEYAYTVFDVVGKVSQRILDEIYAIDGVIRCWVIQK